LFVNFLILQALVDRPDETRRIVNFKRLSMTDLKVDIPRLAKKAVLKKAVEEADVFAKFAASSWGKKLAKRDAKAAQTDFDRYKAAVAKMKHSAQVRRTVNKLKKTAGK
jgi:large subunit ribosomal protein L14e